MAAAFFPSSALLASGSLAVLALLAFDAAFDAHVALNTLNRRGAWLRHRSHFLFKKEREHGKTIVLKKISSNLL